MNLTGMVLFGSGSEWFWVMAQFLVLTVTGIGIYRQLRAQGSANALSAQASLLARWESSELVRLRLAALMDIATGKTGEPPTLSIVGNFFADVAALVTHRHLRPTDSWETWSGQVQFWWAVMGPWLSTFRVGNPGVYGEFEELAATMAELDRKNRVPNFDINDVGPRTEREIGRLIARLRLERDAMRGFVPNWPVQESAHKPDE